MFCGNFVRIVTLGSLIALTAAAARADDTPAIRQSADAFTAAFNKGDAKAVAALWTENGEMVDEAGRTFKGRPAIEAAYAELFKLHPGVKIKVTPGSIRMLSDSSAVEEGSSSLDPAPAGETGTSNYSVVHVKQNGKWLMATVHEMSSAPAAPNSALKDLAWLIGNWSAEEQGAKTEVNCRWLPNNSYISREYKVTAPDGTTTAGVQIIGVNPNTGQVVSWGFGFDGGHTIGIWIPRGNGWGIDAAGVMPDGTETHAMNILTKLDDNGYSWQSVGRTVGGQQRPDTDEIILRRVEAKK